MDREQRRKLAKKIHMRPCATCGDCPFFEWEKTPTTVGKKRMMKNLFACRLGQYGKRYFFWKRELPKNRKRCKVKSLQKRLVIVPKGKTATLWQSVNAVADCLVIRDRLFDKETEYKMVRRMVRHGLKRRWVKRGFDLKKPMPLQENILMVHSYLVRLEKKFKERGE